MSSLPNADKLSFDASRYSYNNIRKLLPDLSEKVCYWIKMDRDNGS